MKYNSEVWLKNYVRPLSQGSGVNSDIAQGSRGTSISGLIT